MTTAGVGCGAFFGSISDHRPVLLGLALHNGHPSLSLGKQAADPGTRGVNVNLDLAQASLVSAYRLHTEKLALELPPPPSQRTLPRPFGPSALSPQLGYTITRAARRRVAKAAGTTTGGLQPPWP